MDLQLNDRVVIVTGAAAGIGQATAGLLTAEGSVAVGVDRDEVESGLGHEGSAIRADLTDGASGPRIVETPDYAAAKLAVMSMSKALATEFTPQGVRSNVVTPGMTRTPLYDRPGGCGDQIAEALGTDREQTLDQVLTTIRPLLTGRIGHPDDLARVIAYLISPLSIQVTGAEWVIDGGALPQI